MGVSVDMKREKPESIQYGDRCGTTPTAKGSDLGAGRLRGILALQRLVGNAAVRSLLSTPVRHPDALTYPVQRFVGPEHAQLGDSTGASVDLGGGVVLTWGQVVAIAGDEYGSIDELEADAKTADGRARIRAALEHDQIPPSAIPGTLPSKTTVVASGKTAEQEQEARYDALVVANLSHFAAGGTAVETWTGHHQDALAKGVDAGIDGDESAHQLALVTEAFGEHFLTDCFSGGHVRTPRTAILDWYSTVFGPKVVIHLIDDLRAHLTANFAAQIAAQLPDPLPPAIPPLSELVSQEVENVLMAFIGPDGMAGLGVTAGIYIAGAVSGTLHDMEGERGVWVNSIAHPTPWVAYGDNRLAQSPDSQSEAEAAIAAAKAQVEQAFDIGGRFRRTVAVPYAPPQTTYFGFDSDILNESARADCQAAGDYLRVHPEVTVSLVGHSCPLGPDAYNYDLGLLRATAIQAVLIGSGADAARISVSSMGENQLVTQDPKEYRLDRRVEFVWGTNPVSVPSREHDEAFEAMNQACPPPYQVVLDRVPREVPDLNSALEDWHWGSMPKNLQDGFNTWVSVHIAPLIGGLLKDKHLDPIYPIPGIAFTIDPRAAVTKETTALLADPVKYLGEAFGVAAGP
jgi:outer membrane protein OmpA-like peptidoglycan-associated protein